MTTKPLVRMMPPRKEAKSNLRPECGLGQGEAGVVGTVVMFETGVTVGVTVGFDVTGASDNFVVSFAEVAVFVVLFLSQPTQSI